MAAAVLWGTTGTAQAISDYGGSSLPLGSARLVVASLILAGIVALRKVPWRRALGSRRTVAVHRPGRAGLVIAGLALTVIRRSPAGGSSP
jgi:hypothetical protein